MFLKILQNSHEKTCVRVSCLIKLQIFISVYMFLSAVAEAVTEKCFKNSYTDSYWLSSICDGYFESFVTFFMSLWFDKIKSLNPSLNITNMFNSKILQAILKLLKNM